jgi:hypothetical protein
VSKVEVFDYLLVRDTEPCGELMQGIVVERMPGSVWDRGTRVAFVGTPGRIIVDGEDRWLVHYMDVRCTIHAEAHLPS